MKSKKVLIILLITIAIVITTIILVNVLNKNNNESQEGNLDDYNLKISIDYGTEPTMQITYYFYDNSVIKENKSAGVTDKGVKNIKETTKYYFDEEIDISNLKKVIKEYPITEKNSNDAYVYITEKGGNTYSINTSTQGDSKRLFTTSKLSNEIEKIIEKAKKIENI